MGCMKLPALQQILIRRVLPLACAVLLSLSPGCGGHSTGSVAPADHPPAVPAGDGAAQSGAHNVLSTSMPALDGLSAGAEFDFIIRIACRDEIYQGSGRVQYEAAVMQPVSAKRGMALPAEHLFSVKLDAADAGDGAASGATDGAGVVPFAFTGLPGSSHTALFDGELFRLRFRLVQRPRPGTSIRLVNSPEYLQLRDPQGQRLPFDLHAEVASP